MLLAKPVTWTLDPNQANRSSHELLDRVCNLDLDLDLAELVLGLDNITGGNHIPKAAVSAKRVPGCPHFAIHTVAGNGFSPKIYGVLRSLRITLLQIDC